MRFQSSSKTSPPKIGMARRQRSKVWLLLLALGLVVMAMRHLGKPSTADRLEQLFSSQKQATESPRAEHPAAAAEREIRLENNVLVLDSEANQTKLEETRVETHEEISGAGSTLEQRAAGLSKVKDRTFFRGAEQEAWFNLFARLQATDPKELTQASQGPVTYTQLLKQPDVYRGRLVTIQGTVLKEEMALAEANKLGIQSYHRLWVHPEGGGPSLAVAYCLKLPESFPQGDKLRSQVQITGYFFKNWSYPWENGLALAPVLLVNSFSWEPPVAFSPAAPVASRTIIMAMVGACLSGLTVALLVVRYSGRRPRLAGPASARLELPDDWKEVEAVTRPAGKEGEL